MKTITKKKDGKERSIGYAQYPETLKEKIERFGEDGINALADSALTIRLQAVTAVMMDEPDEKIIKAYNDFKPGQGHGGSGRKQALVASIMDADQLGIFTTELLKTMKIAQLEDILQRLSK
jgi:hypothetical protein